ncbi:hypothetical protein PPACK8108_LOCUS710 [Phakopsora pachyrhizi]|uniref:MI domain-containing protein n=1 Tax=Phakopsora pachyrhizi TaxID=170000 RepID=A0AAV0AH33_PHAPC|nr:hypothetical protein PPACK8108_LOCUS710 [Phakopsora pachyrhizi]
MAFHRGNHKKQCWSSKRLSLPTQLTAELTALGHDIKSYSKPRGQKAYNKTYSNPSKLSSNHPPSESISNGKNKSKRFDHINKADAKNNVKRKREKDEIHNESQAQKQTLNEPIKKLKPTQTPLEKLCLKQTSFESKKAVSSSKQKLTKEEELEDKRIAWLESQLGLGGDRTSAKEKLRQEFEEDGLEDLFDGLDGLDKLVNNLSASRSIVDTTGSFESEKNEMSLSENSDDLHDLELGCDNFPNVETETSWSGCQIDDINEQNSLLEPSINIKAINSTKVIVEERIQSELKPSTSSSRYVPPHLRQKKSNDVYEVTAKSKDAPKMDNRLRRQLMGILNRVSPTSLPMTLLSLKELYLSHPRAIITHGICETILQLILSKESIGDTLSVTYAALVAAISRGGVQVSGVEIGWAATFVAELSTKVCHAYEASEETVDSIGKSGVNLLGFLSNLYLFQVVSSTLVYDFFRMLIDEGLSEHRVEGLMVFLKACGHRLRHDDPASLKEIVLLVSSKKKEMTNINSRTKFMFETLTDLKNNKNLKKVGSVAGTAEEHLENLKKYLNSLSKNSSCSSEPLRFSLKELKAAPKIGKWWFVGSGWDGDPLAEKDLENLGKPSKPDLAQDNLTNLAIIKLAKKQGMNTDVRKSIFSCLMTSEDYVDACDRINQLSLTSVQKREVVKVLLHCLGNEVNYNPYYTMIGQKLANESHSIQITMQFSLWDFFRELGQVDVGGEELIKKLADDCRTEFSGSNVKMQRIHNLACAYGWWIAKGSLPITVLKPLPFDFLKVEVEDFLSKIMARIFLASQTNSPLVASINSSLINKIINVRSKRDSSPLEKIFLKNSSKLESNDKLFQGIESFLGSDRKFRIFKTKNPRKANLNDDNNVVNGNDGDRKEELNCFDEAQFDTICWAKELVINILSNSF